jgi:sialidase-1
VSPATIMILQTTILCLIAAAPLTASAVGPQYDPNVLPKGREYFELRDGLGNCRAKFEHDKTGRIAFLGGSITHNPGWRDELMRYFQKKFPRTKFDFIAAGIPSLGSVPHAFRLQRDVLAHGPLDLLFVEAAVNDHNYDGLPDAKRLALRGMEGVVRHVRMSSPKTDIVEMHFVHDIDLKPWGEGKMPYTVAAHEQVAECYGCPSLNLSREVADRIAAGQFTWAGDFRDLHPSPFGQKVYANSMMRMLDAAFAKPAAPSAKHPLPAPLDPKSYFRGRLGKLGDAKLIKGFVCVTDWTPIIPRSTRPGYVHVPAITATAAGSTFEFAFDGTAAGLMIGAGPDAGMLKVTCDGSNAKTIDTFTQWSPSLYLPWAVMLADDLAPGRHVVRVELLKEHNPRSRGTALHIFNLLAN